MKNIQGKLKTEFPHDNCFLPITKLIVRLHYMPLNPEQMLRSYRKIHI